MAVLMGCTNPTFFATAARSYGARVREKDFAYENEQNELGCFRLAGLSRDGHEVGGCNYLGRMWEERANLEPRSLCADVLFWRFFRRCGAQNPNPNPTPNPNPNMRSSPFHSETAHLVTPTSTIAGTL